ncbi:MAG: IPT/TIG domain-containing protein [Acidobacteriota bacterium]
MKNPTIIRLHARALIFAVLLLTIAGAAISAQAQVTVVSAASFATDKVLAPGEIAAAFGTFNTQNNQVFIANSLPLPTTLGGVKIRIGNTDAPLFFVAPSQINLQIPDGTADGQSVTVTVTNANGTTTTGTLTIVRSAVGIFSARATGQGAAAGQTTFDGVVYQNTYNPDGTEKEVNAGTRANPNILVLYTTGLRNTPAANPNDGNGVAEAVSVKIQGVPATVLYAGPAPNLIGVDQVNAIIPPELSGLGSVSVRLRANNRDSNIVTIKIGGTVPEVRASPIVFGQSLTGALTADDQVQAGSLGSTFFFDAYSFTTTVANTSIAVDLRSTDFDAAVLLYRVDTLPSGGKQLSLIAADDESGNLGSAESANNHNAMLMTVIQNPGNYAIFASSSDLNPNGLGNYSLRLLSNVATQITYGQTLNGSITTSDVQNSLGIYYDIFWFSGVQGDNVRMNLNSVAFDPFLFLYRNDGDPYITFDDNGGGGPTGRNSQITNRLTGTGIYLWVCTPYEANKTGDYSVTLAKLPGFGAEANADGLWNQVLKVPGRQLPGSRAGLIDPEKPSIERFGTRRIIEP